MINRKLASFSLLVLFLLLWTPGCSDISTHEIDTPSHRIQAEEGDLVFFSFDDYSIPWRDNLKLTLEKPKRHPGNPVFRPGPAGSVDDWGVLLYGTVLKIGDRLRMWYIAWPQPYPEERGVNHQGISPTSSPR